MNFYELRQERLVANNPERRKMLIDALNLIGLKYDGQYDRDHGTSVSIEIQRLAYELVHYRIEIEAPPNALPMWRVGYHRGLRGELGVGRAPIANLNDRGVLADALIKAADLAELEAKSKEGST